MATVLGESQSAHIHILADQKTTPGKPLTSSRPRPGKIQQQRWRLAPPPRAFPPHPLEVGILVTVTVTVAMLPVINGENQLRSLFTY